MEYELQDIRSFVKIAELGSFHEAAEALHLSQPALSRRIKKLEEGLGTSLLERTTRRVSLTSVGRDFLPKARRLLDDFEDSILSIRELAERQSGQVTLACIPTAAFYFLPSVIRDYNEQYPKIRIRLLDLSANDGLEAVLRGEADFGINMMRASTQTSSSSPWCRSISCWPAEETTRWRTVTPSPGQSWPTTG